MWSTVSSSWQPPPIANVSAAAIHSFSVSGWLRPAVDLVHEAEVADREEQIGDLAAVEVREVQARRRRSAGRRSAGARRRRRAGRAISTCGIEQHQVDRRPPAGRSCVSSSALRWRGLRSSTVPTLPRRATRGGAEVDVPGRARARPGARARARRAQHHVDQVPAACPGWRARGRGAGPARSRARPCPSAGARARPPRPRATADRAPRTPDPRRAPAV